MEANMEETFFTRMTNSDFTIWIWVLTIFTLSVFLIKYLRSKIKGYLDFNNKLKSMQEDYERKRKCRNDLKYHFYWSIERGERNSAKNIGKEILKLDETLNELYQEYYAYKEKKSVPLKKI